MSGMCGIGHGRYKGKVCPKCDDQDLPIAWFAVIFGLVILTSVLGVVGKADIEPTPTISQINQDRVCFAVRNGFAGQLDEFGEPYRHAVSLHTMSGNTEFSNEFVADQSAWIEAKASAHFCEVVILKQGAV